MRGTTLTHASLTCLCVQLATSFVIVKVPGHQLLPSLSVSISASYRDEDQSHPNQDRHPYLIDVCCCPLHHKLILGVTIVQHLTSYLQHSTAWHTACVCGFSRAHHGQYFGDSAEHGTAWYAYVGNNSRAHHSMACCRVKTQPRA
jgi:hypothetical protein